MYTCILVFLVHLTIKVTEKKSSEVHRPRIAGVWSDVTGQREGFTTSLSLIYLF